ncbi:MULTISPECIES: DUF4399 domain-containing protein [Caballeronia]|uniref:Rod shape-determining protein RodA n=1 Tax=Caballeronia cordobensis TaxID=1353886 RepID=A0A158FD55_CABCO|nr:MULTISPECIES: DUF4399 domain-containing protein [Caballeronia]AET88612.1 hypothetical protein BYI23_A007740 [Burkholderia sp. YI23]AQG98078.1 rod shape-determining protein RodA [Burkholderia sp. KK1]BAO85827.1 putative uncharacterized protein [Burkholderia sp. RPE67]BBP95659.1 rod shape-determining protein RodA [Burkholderia sp. SFA1]MCE4568503.1 DUF4399 domain-containing protein [Caballeronia sp. CLC5]
MKQKLLSAMLSGAILLSFAGAAHAQARVYFVEPKDGATVTSPVHVKFGVDGMSVAPAGTMTEGTGHHHLLIDEKPIPKGTVIPMDDKNLHYGKGQTEADVKLPPGDHTLTMQFADGAHRSYGPEMSQTIKVHVKQ